MHVFAFTSRGDLLVAESEGSFDLDQWENAHAEAKTVCCKVEDTDAMEQDDAAPNLQSFVEHAVDAQTETAQKWKNFE